MQAPHSQLISNLQAQIHDCLKDYIQPDRHLACLDFPDIKNCGDSAIWLGQMAYLRNWHKVQPNYISRMKDFSKSAMLKRIGDGQIFLHGGGNFGDIWLGHQKFREMVLNKLPGRQIVQFPQSIHFQSKTHLESARRAIGRHGNFVLLVRDEKSLHFAQQQFDCVVKLCPDMAFCIGDIPTDKPSLPILAMLRQDKEKASNVAINLPSGIPCEDWMTENKMDVRRAKFSGIKSAIRDRAFSEIRLRMLNAAANNRFQRGIKQISRAQAIVTDRLHVHICSLLIGRPHAALDNNYGKIYGFMDTFSGKTPLSHKAASLEEGIAWAQQQI
ncbi:polysaccharide pyruvyl transferase family protein [Pigmentiphaga daeguensis]|uniref:Polysaccharide pyruvyl transferase family protein n=1 Tax=Pigmentiphaga daeguensis TaxID=414049 RepID=A0ABN1D5N4_9BURK